MWVGGGWGLCWSLRCWGFRVSKALGRVLPSDRRPALLKSGRSLLNPHRIEPRKLGLAWPPNILVSA